MADETLAGTRSSRDARPSGYSGGPCGCCSERNVARVTQRAVPATPLSTNVISLRACNDVSASRAENTATIWWPGRPSHVSARNSPLTPRRMRSCSCSCRRRCQRGCSCPLPVSSRIQPCCALPAAKAAMFSQAPRRVEAHDVLSRACGASPHLPRDFHVRHPEGQRSLCVIAWYVDLVSASLPLRSPATAMRRGQLSPHCVHR